MRMCVRVHMNAYAYGCGYVYMCVFLQWVLHALWNRYFERRCVRYTGVFLRQRTHLRTQSLQVVHICVYLYICVYACICIWKRICVYDIICHVKTLLLTFSICAYVCIYMRMYMCVHVCVYRCMCICMYMYMCMCMYMYSYTFIYTRVWLYMCTRVGAFCLFVLSNLSATCACITGVS